MHMLYNSDSYAVVVFEISGQPGDDAQPAISRGGFEIVDKFAKKGVFIEGAVAESFKNDVETLIASKPSEEDIDDFLERFSGAMRQPLVLH